MFGVVPPNSFIVKKAEFLFILVKKTPTTTNLKQTNQNPYTPNLIHSKILVIYIHIAPWNSMPQAVFLLVK